MQNFSSSSSTSSSEQGSSYNIQKHMESMNLRDKLLRKTSIQRMIEYRASKTLTDLKIKIENKESHGHKIVLIDASSVLATMISER